MHEDQVAGLALLEEPELRCLGALDSVRILRLDARQSRHPSYLGAPAEGAITQLGADERQVPSWICHPAGTFLKVPSIMSGSSVPS